MSHILLNVVTPNRTIQSPHNFYGGGDNMEKTILEEYTSGIEPIEEHKVEGVGTVKVYGELNVEKLVQRLLKTKYMNI